MSETAPTIAQLRQWFPASRWEDSELQTAIEAGSGTDTQRLCRARLFLLRQTYGQLLADPTRWTANGDYSEDHTAQMRALKAEIRECETMLGETPEANGIDPSLPTLTGGACLFRSDQENSFVSEREATAGVPVPDGERGIVTRRNIW